MKIGSPYIQFAVAFRAFLEKHGFQSPAEFHRELERGMGRKPEGESPSASEVYMVFYGARRFNGVTMAFLGERYGWRPGWRVLRQIKSRDGKTLKTNEVSLPGMLELRGLK